MLEEVFLGVLDQKPKYKQQSKVRFALSGFPPLSNIFCRNAIILDQLIYETVLGLRRVIRHHNLIVDDVVHLTILTQLLHQLNGGDATQISRQSREMLDLSTIFVDRGTLVLGVSEHEDVLRDNLAGAFGDLPDFVVFSDEGAIFGDGAAFGDEPGHVEDFELAVVVIPIMVSNPLCKKRRMGMHTTNWSTLNACCYHTCS